MTTTRILIYVSEKPLNARVPERLIERLQEASTLTGRPMKELVSAALDDFLPRIDEMNFRELEARVRRAINGLAEHAKARGDPPVRKSGKAWPGGQ